MRDGLFTITLYGTDKNKTIDSNSEIDKITITRNSATATFTASSANVDLDINDLAVGDRVTFTTTGTLPVELSTAVTYYIVYSSALIVKVSLTEGGSAITMSDTGTGTHTINYDTGLVNETYNVATIYPLKKEDIKTRKTGGCTEVNTTIQYDSYHILFATFFNNADKRADKVLIDTFYQIMNKRYYYIEFIDYWDTLQTANKLTAITIPTREIKELGGFLELDIKANKRVANG